MIPFVLLADYAGTLDLSDTTNIAIRTTQPPPIFVIDGRDKKVIIATDLVTVPSGRVTLKNRRWSYSLGYSPSFTTVDAELGFRPSAREVITGSPDFTQIVHSGTANASWHDRTTQLSLSESFSYGRSFVFQQLVAPAQNALGNQAMSSTESAMGGTTTSPGQTGMGAMGMGATGATSSALTTPIEFASSTTTVRASLHPSSAMSFLLTGGYTLTGGITSAARQVLPEIYGPVGSVLATYAPTNRDALLLSATGGDTYFSGTCAQLEAGSGIAAVEAAGAPCNGWDPSISALAGLRHIFSDSASLSLLAGPALLDVQTSTVIETIVAPELTATLTDRPTAHGTTTLALATSLSPTVDFLTGLPSYRLQSTLTLTQPASHIVTVKGTAGEIKSIPFPTDQRAGGSGWTFTDPDPLTALTADINVRLRIDRVREVVVGTNDFWQYQSGLGTLATTGLYVRGRFDEALDVAVGTSVSWQDLTGYATLAAAGTRAAPPVQNGYVASVSGYVTLIARVPTVRF